MTTTPQIIRTPKAYYVTRRIEGHSDWSFAFWRELFQNSVDAGAKRIDITIGEADGKGSFGREAALDRVVRVGFSDDGSGMDGDVLQNVFFQPGQSTKDMGDGNTGGFGTARLMLCFSQVRYGIRTKDWVVEGDGSEYTCLTVPQALEAKRAEIAAVEAQADAAVDPGAADALRSRIEVMRADLAALEADQGTRKGCRFEIDINPNETDKHWRNVDLYKLTNKLDEYLSMSQVPCKVYVNGREVDAKALRGPAKRKLVVDGPDGTPVVFGTIHSSQGDRARHKGRIIVRSGGAAMFTEDTSSSHQVIVELDPMFSKEILTESRDGLKQPFRAALAGFVEELVVDTKSALEEKDKRKHIEIKGGRGKLKASVPITPISFSADGTVRKARDASVDQVPGAEADAPPAALPKARYSNAEEYEVQGFGGVPKPVMDSFIQAVADGEETFLTQFDRAEDVTAFVDAVRQSADAAALQAATPELAEFMAATITERMAEAGVAPEAAEDRRFADMHDLHIQLDDIDGDDKLKNALRRHHPNYWRRKGESLEGRGMQAHMLLAAWTVSVEYAVKALLSQEPGLAPEGELDYATGWYFGKSQRHYTSRGWTDVRTGAQHQDRDGTHLFLLNPIFDNYAAAFDLTKERREQRFDGEGREETLGIQDLENLAIHEACHVMTSRHDEEFANLQTAVAAMFDRAGARAAMRDAIDAVRAAYGRGKTRVQAMDSAEPVAVLDADADKPGKAKKAKSRKQEPRPAERLLAHAAPLAAMAVGTAAAPENADFPADALKDAFAGAVTQLEGGVTEVDCDRLQSLEAGVAAAAKNDWEAPIDLNAVAVADVADEGLAELAGFEDDLAALAADLPTEVPASPAPKVAARGTVWEAPIDLSQMDGLSELNAPDLSALDGLGDDLAALAADVPPPAVSTKPVAAPAPDALPSPATTDHTPAAVPLPPVATSSELSSLDGFGDDLAELAEAPLPRRAEPQLAGEDSWGAPIDMDADFPPVVEDPGLDEVAGLIGEDFDLNIFEASEEPKPALGMR